MTSRLEKIQSQIISALGHVEAEDGLYFNNLIVLHVDEERSIVNGTSKEVHEALDDLIQRGIITSDGQGEKTIFKLKENAPD